MLRKNAYLLLGLMLLNLVAISQRLDTNWVHQFDRVSSYSKALITTIDSNNYFTIYGDKYYVVNNAGDSVKAGSADYNVGFTGALASSSNGIFVGGTQDRKPAIAKLDMNYDTLWTKTVYDTRSSRGIASILLDGNDIYVGGSVNSREPFVSKLDQNGDTIWTMTVPQTSFSNFSSIIKLKDGNFLASGNYDDYPLAAKFDSNGDTIWTYSNRLFISFSQSSAFEKPNGDIVLVPERKFVTLDANGKEKSVVDLTSSFLDLVIEKDTVYLTGVKDNMPYVESRTLNLDSISSLRLTENISAVNGGGVFNSAITCVGGGFIAAGRVRDSVNIIANTWNVKMAKFNGGAFVPTPVDTSKPADTTNIAEHNKINKLIVYPNPARDIINVDLEGIQELHIFNATGQELALDSNAVQVDVSDFENGLYFIVAVADNKIYRETFMIAH